MDPITELFLLLWVLYLLECLRWVSPSSAGLRALVPGRWRLVRPHRPGTHWKRALLPTAPWPPLGELFVCDELPFRVGPEGLVLSTWRPEGWTRAANDESLLRFDELDRLRVSGTELSLDGKVVWAFGTRRMALSVAGLLKALRGSEKKREKALQAFLDARFDPEEARRRVDAFRRAVRPLVLACNLLLVLFVAGLALLLWMPYRVNLVALLVELAVVWIATGALFEWTLRRVLPKALRPPLGRRIITLLSPLSLVRAHDELRVEVLGDLDPLCAGAVLLQEKGLATHARDALAALAFPLSPEDPADEGPSVRTEEWLRNALQECVRRLVAKSGLDPEDLLDAPPPNDPGASAWCPRCRATFAQDDGRCSSCRGVELRRLGGVSTASDA